MMPPRTKGVVHCLHGLKRELPPYRHVRIWEMNCGEVRCSLSERDYFQPQHINEFIDAALDGKNRPNEWMFLNRAELHKAQKAATLAAPANPSTPAVHASPTKKSYQ